MEMFGNEDGVSVGLNTAISTPLVEERDCEGRLIARESENCAGKRFASHSACVNRLARVLCPFLQLQKNRIV